MEQFQLMNLRILLKTADAGGCEMKIAVEIHSDDDKDYHVHKHNN
jgi:hypothetical protein